MEKNRIFSITLIVMVTVFGWLIISSCSTGFTTHSPAKKLDTKAKSLSSNQAYSAIGVWNLKIIDQTGLLSEHEPKLTIGPIGAAKTLCYYLKTGKTIKASPGAYLSQYSTVEPMNGSWVQNPDKSIYNGLFVVALQPGEREFFHLRLERQDEEWGLKYEKWLSVPLNAPCRIEAHKLYDLGYLELKITDRILKDDGKFHFNYMIRSASAERDSTKKRLKEHYPQLNISSYEIIQDCTFGGSSSICK